MKNHLKFIFLNAFLFFLFFGNAQIVNIEDKRTSHADSTAWHGQVRLGFNLVENGSSIISFNGGFNLEYIKGKHWFLSLTNFNFIQIEKQDFINNGFQHLRYNYKINRWIIYEAFTQAQYDERLRLQLRWLLGTGLRVPIIEQDKNKVFLGLTYMYEYNEENDPDLEFRDHRLSTYVSFKVEPFQNASLSSTTYYQPVFNEVNDLRLSSKTALNINLTSRLQFSTTFNITYDSRVPEEVANTIYSLKNGIRWNF